MLNPIVARIEPPGPASGRPNDKLREMRGRPFPDVASLHPGYSLNLIGNRVAL